MNQPISRYLGLVLAALVVLLVIPALASAQETPPTIPHPLEGRDACLVCHETGAAGAPQVPEDHAGRTNDICQYCHQPAAATAPAAAPVTEGTPTAETPPASETAIATVEAPATATRTRTAPTATPTLARQITAAATAPTATPTATPTPISTPTPAPTATPTPAGPLPVPHTLQDRENCLECHTSPEATVAPAGGPPFIPHPLIGREHCLACHQDGVGGAPQVPQDHAGRTNDICQACHQPGQIPAPPTPTPLAEPIPTPIAYPRVGGVNTCYDCHATLEGKHADITAQWQRSIHAERDVTCADCHGGDPSATTVDEAMSPAAGYIGAPAKADIPALCASCHADVALMRQYDLPTDQYAKYRESIHGVRLAEGDQNVATCFDCHGGHQVLKPNDPASSVYPANVPEMCASCHADKELMAPYDIPTNQFDLYRQSVHGHALLDRQDFRAPNCATCHGTHGAAPPGFAEVANVCGSCHTATQDYYLQSPHAKAGDGAPKCVTCHGRYDVSKPTDALYLGTEPRHCGSCHPPDSAPGQVAQSLYDEVTSAAQAYEEAEAAVQAAQQLGMLTTLQERQLREANTSLITARAAQHTLHTDTVRDLTDEGRTVAEEAKAGAEAAVAESIFRRRAMVVAIAAIALTIVALYLIKRELDRRLEDAASED